ncbi:MAG: RES family NAD+ phosphorylase [Beijerinckiaceae bacterium]|nr:RES family NAD+ phosphorylase [Beijerinckiaceae bacterium]
MRFWRLSIDRLADRFDGGYGLLHDGRWNLAGRPVTYAATSPALCVLEKLVHIEDPALMPRLAMVTFEAPDDLAVDELGLDDLPASWRRDETLTQRLGSEWLGAMSAAILRVPSAIVSFPGGPDFNLVINHMHRDAGAIRIASTEPFELDLRLL